MYHVYDTTSALLCLFTEWTDVERSRTGVVVGQPGQNAVTPPGSTSKHKRRDLRPFLSSVVAVCHLRELQTIGGTHKVVDNEKLCRGTRSILRRIVCTGIYIARCLLCHWLIPQLVRRVFQQNHNFERNRAHRISGNHGGRDVSTANCSTYEEPSKPFRHRFAQFVAPVKCKRYTNSRGGWELKREKKKKKSVLVCMLFGCCRKVLLMTVHITHSRKTALGEIRIIMFCCFTVLLHPGVVYRTDNLQRVSRSKSRLPFFFIGSGRRADGTVFRNIYFSNHRGSIHYTLYIVYAFDCKSVNRSMTHAEVVGVIVWSMETLK